MAKQNRAPATQRAAEAIRAIPGRFQRPAQPAEEATPPTGANWTHFLQFLRPVPKDSLITEGAAQTLELLFRFGQVQDPKEQAWLIDQAVRTLTGERYEDFIEAYSFDEEFGNSYSWSQGVAPKSAESAPQI